MVNQPTGMFVDPREKPSRRLQRTPTAATFEFAEIEELLRSCRDGRIYAVEEWIRSGKPLYVLCFAEKQRRRRKTALAIAIETNQYDLALLLLCNGFPPDPPGESLLALALRRRAWGFVDLLLEWGADPTRLDSREVLNTYKPISSTASEAQVSTSRPVMLSRMSWRWSPRTVRRMDGRVGIAASRPFSASWTSRSGSRPPKDASAQPAGTVRSLRIAESG